MTPATSTPRLRQVRDHVMQFTAQPRSQCRVNPVRERLMGDPALDVAITQLGERLLALRVGRPDVRQAAFSDVVGCHT
jgi:hypothetical protein